MTSPAAPAGRRRRLPILAIAAVAVAAALALGVAVVAVDPFRAPAADRPPAAALDPAALAWERLPLDDLAASGIVEISRLAVVGDRFVGFATGQFDEVRNVPDTSVLVSDDGRTWQEVGGPISDLRVDTATAVDGTIWAFGQVGPAKAPEHQVWTSPDGVAWTRLEGVTGMDFGPGFVAEVARSATGWVAVCWDTIDVESSAPMILASADGRAWERAVLPSPGVVLIQALAAGPAGFVVGVTFADEIGGQHAVAWLSQDGRSWTEHLIERGNRLVSVSDVAATAAGYVAVGFESESVDWRPAAWVSADGRAWQVAGIEVPADGQVVINLVGRAGSGLVGVGQAFAVEDRPVAWSSSDGLGWQAIRDWPGRFGEFPTDVAATAGAVLVAGQRGTLTATTPIVWLGTPR